MLLFFYSIIKNLHTGRKVLEYRTQRLRTCLGQLFVMNECILKDLKYHKIDPKWHYNKCFYPMLIIF